MCIHNQGIYGDECVSTISQSVLVVIVSSKALTLLCNQTLSKHAQTQCAYNTVHKIHISSFFFLSWPMLNVNSTYTSPILPFTILTTPCSLWFFYLNINSERKKSHFFLCLSFNCTKNISIENNNNEIVKKCE